MVSHSSWCLLPSVCRYVPTLGWHDQLAAMWSTAGFKSLWSTKNSPVYKTPANLDYHASHSQGKSARSVTMILKGKSSSFFILFILLSLYTVFERHIRLMHYHSSLFSVLNVLVQVPNLKHVRHRRSHVWVSKVIISNDRRLVNNKNVSPWRELL